MGPIVGEKPRKRRGRPSAVDGDVNGDVNGDGDGDENAQLAVRPDRCERAWSEHA
jgi:hypothetical protein